MGCVVRLKAMAPLLPTLRFYFSCFFNPVGRSVQLDGVSRLIELFSMLLSAGSLLLHLVGVFGVPL